MCNGRPVARRYLRIYNINWHKCIFSTSSRLKCNVAGAAFAPSQDRLSNPPLPGENERNMRVRRLTLLAATVAILMTFISSGAHPALAGQAWATPSATRTLTTPASMPAPQTSPYAVTRMDDPVPDGCNVGDCSLREAIIAANAFIGEATIILPAGSYTLTIASAVGDENAGDFDVTGNVTIAGAGAATTVIQACDADANPNCTGIDRVFQIMSLATAHILGVTIRNGAARPGSTGGGIANGGTLRVE